MAFEWVDTTGDGDWELVETSDGGTDTSGGGGTDTSGGGGTDTSGGTSYGSVNDVPVGVRSQLTDGTWVTKAQNGAITYEDPDGQSYTVSPSGKYSGGSGGSTWTYDPATGASSGTGAYAGGFSSAGWTNVLKNVKGLYSTKNPTTGQDELDITKILPLLSGAYSATQSNTRTQPAGYQGGIPKYTAERQAPTGDQAISGNVLYKKADGTPVNPGVVGLPAATTPPNQRLQDLLGSVGYNSAGMATKLPDAQAAVMPQKAAGGGLAGGGFVVPADVVSHFGNGSSDAGLKTLAAKLGAKPIKGHGDGMSDSIPTTIDGKQRAAVAHEEAYLSPEQVARIGGGDAKKGAQKLREMMDRIRQARTGTKQQGKQIDPAKFMPGGSVQRYVEGGTTGTGSTAGTNVNAGITGTESNLSNWAGPYVTDMLAKGQALSEMPYEQYTGPLTAGASSLQQKGFEGLEKLNFPGNLGQSFSSTTAPTIGAGGQPTGATGIAANYMNPYLSAVLNPQLEEMRRQSQINLQPNLAKLTQAGGFGGGRQAIMESEANRNLLQEQDKLVGQGYANAYDKAQNQFNIEQGQAKGLADLFAQQGATQRDIAQQGLTAEKNAFEEARANPYKMVQFQQSLLQGLPLSAQTYNMQDTNNLTQFMQGLSTVSELLKKLNVGP